jgi:hypothetical protein
MARTSFGFGLVITASMTESWLAAADDSNFPLAATASQQRPPQNSPGKDRHLGVGCWLRRGRVRTFVAVCCERALLAKSVASALSGIRAAPSRLTAPVRPPIDRLSRRIQGCSGTPFPLLLSGWP